MNTRSCSRREFCLRGARLGLALGAGALSVPGPPWLCGLLGGDGSARADDTLRELLETAPRARYWTPVAGAAGCAGCHGGAGVDTTGESPHPPGAVQCRLCARNCLIEPDRAGGCRARMNVDGELRSLVYGRPISIHVDPIEKKPLYHFLPGATAYSMATAGCPLHCRFCQNWEISQARPDDYPGAYVPPERIVASAAERDVPVIAFTYNEPTVFTEYLTDIARRARPDGRRTVMISCGFMNPEPLDEMCEVLDAIKIDLKGFSPEFYRNVCQAELDPVLRTIARIGRSKVHLEIVNLVVPTLNDSDDMLRDLARWVVGEVGPDVPIHFTRFHPDYLLVNLPPTPVATLERARAIAGSEGVRHAYVGNVPGHPGNNTVCPACHRDVIVRKGFFVVENHLKGGRCGYCQEPIAGVWS